MGWPVHGVDNSLVSVKEEVVEGSSQYQYTAGTLVDDSS